VAEVGNQQLCVPLSSYSESIWTDTRQWEWHNNYSPGPEVYDQLWHIRNEPATVTPFLATECPVRNAQSRILDRRQTEGDIQRNFYVVEVIHSSVRGSSTSSTEHGSASNTQTLHVDLSRILEYVSPSELEHFENEQFRIEAEAEAIAMRVEAEELARRRLEKNARIIATGQGSRLLGELSLAHEVRTRGRPRGRGRGRGRGSWHGRGARITNSQSREDDMREELVDVEPEDMLRRVEEDMQFTIAETESDEDDFAAHKRGPTSPSIARSAFVANSALPVPPILSHRRLAAVPSTQYDEDDSDLGLVNVDSRSMSSAAMQLHIEDDVHMRSDGRSEDKTSKSGHRSKRRRTESTAPNQRTQPNDSTLAALCRPYRHVSDALSIPESPAASEFSDNAIPLPPRPVYNSLQYPESDHKELDSIHVRTSIAESPAEDESEDDDGNDAEEYVVEAIIDHYCDDDNKKWYLVKWQGYENSHDWLAAEDLGGAAELVSEYNARMRRKKKKKSRA
jgi:hypothetical protein